MTPEDLAEIEMALNVVLPKSFADLMKVYPLDKTNSMARMSLLEGPGELIAFNYFLREQFDGYWRATYFAFGNNACGDPFILDTSSGSDEVWRFDHETSERSIRAANFAAWLADWESEE